MDGFPRDIDRWQTFKETVKDKWRPDQRAMVILLKVTKDLARERYVNRGREGDEFETRFEAWNSKVRDIEESMRNDGLFVLNIVVDKDADAEDVAKVVEKSDFWRSHVSRS